MPNATTRRAASLVGIIVVCAAVSIVAGASLLQRVTRMHALARGGNAYFQPEHALVLYGITPLVVVAGFVWFLAPGLLTVAAAGRTRSAAGWLLEAFGTSFIFTVVLGTAAKIVTGLPLEPAIYTGLWIAATMTAAISCIARASSRRLDGVLAEWTGTHTRRLCATVAIVLLGVGLLLPKLFWEDFNLDGIEAFEFGRSLERHFLPHWDIRDGIFGFYPNFVSFAFVNHWFTNLSGPVEAAARLPFVLYLALLFPALLSLIEHANLATLRFREEAGLALGLAVFAMVQVYSTNYEPFHADIAEMAATDTFTLLCFLATCWALWSARWGWFIAFGLMTYTATPGGLLLLAALFAGTLFDRAAGSGKRLRILAALVAACFLLGTAHDLFYRPAGFETTINQFSTRGLVRRLFPPTLDRFERFAPLVFASGVLPSLSLLVMRRHDAFARVIAVATAVYFGVIYVQVWTSVHQFTPVMLLPLVVFWRLYLGAAPATRHWLFAGIAAGSIACLILSAPPHWQISTGVRQLGTATSYRIGDYHANYREAAGAVLAIDALLPSDYRIRYPDQPWGADGYAWLYYAMLPKPDTAIIDYIVQPSEVPSPAGFIPLGTSNDARVFARSLEALERDRHYAFPPVAASPLYEPILRNTYAYFRRFTEEQR